MTRQEKLDTRCSSECVTRDRPVVGRSSPESSVAGKAFETVARAAADVETYATAKLLTAEEGKKSKAAARAIVERLTTIARTARVIAETTPGADGVFQLPEKKSDVALLTTARAFIREGEAAKERFVTLGMPDTFVAELEALVDGFEQAIRDRRAGKTGLAAAQAGLKTRRWRRAPPRFGHSTSVPAR